MTKNWAIFAVLACATFACNRIGNGESPQTSASNPASAISQQRIKPASQPKEITKIKVPELGVNSLAFSPDNQMLAIVGGWSTSLSSKGYLALWDLKSGKYLHMSEVRGDYKLVAFPNNGKFVVAASSYEVHIWRLDGWKPEILTTAWPFIDNLAIAPDGKPLAVAGSMPWRVPIPGIIVYDLEKHKELCNLQGKVTKVAFVDQGHILIGSHNNDIKIWNTDSWKPSDKEIPKAIERKATLEYSSKSETYDLVIKELPAGTELLRFNVGNLSLSNLTLSDDGSHLVAINRVKNDQNKDDSQIVVWKIR